MFTGANSWRTPAAGAFWIPAIINEINIHRKQLAIHLTNKRSGIKWVHILIYTIYLPAPVLSFSRQNQNNVEREQSIHWSSLDLLAITGVCEIQVESESIVEDSDSVCQRKPGGRVVQVNTTCI